MLRDLEGWSDEGANISPGSCVMSSSNISHINPNIHQIHLTSERADDLLDKSLDQPENGVISISSCYKRNLEIFIRFFHTKYVQPNNVLDDCN